MDPIPIAAYLDARSKSREKRDEQLRAMAMAAMQQQLGMAQQGSELRDREFSRNMQTKQFDQQKILNDLQVAEAQRLSKINPVKDKQAFIMPLLDPYNAYTAAATAYADYMKPGAVKFRPPSEVRKYADALRAARAAAIAARTSIGKLGSSVGMEGITPDMLERDYPINDLPVISSGGMASVNQQVAEPTNQSLSAARPIPSSMPGAIRPSPQSTFTGQRSPTTMGLGVGTPRGSSPPPPPAPPENEPATRTVPGEVPVPPRKYSGPPIQVSPFKSSVLKFKSIIEPLKVAEGDIQYSDLYEPQQKQADAVAAEMFADALDSFVPRTWNRLASGRDHAEMNAADFAEYGLNPEYVSSLMARYAHGDAMGMKSVIAERFLSMFSPYNMPSKLTEKFVKSAKDKADLDEAADRLVTTKQGRDINAKQEERAAAAGRVALETGKTELGIKQKTAKTTIALLERQLANANKEGLKADLQLEALRKAKEKGAIPVWGKILGSANDFWSKMFDNRIGATIKLASTILQNRRNTIIESDGNYAAIDASLDKLSRLQGMLNGPTTAYIRAYQSNSPTLLEIVNSHKRSMYDIVKDDPNLKDQFANLGGTLLDGSPGNN
jgi:hypothetical protein